MMIAANEKPRGRVARFRAARGATLGQWLTVAVGAAVGGAVGALLPRWGLMWALAVGIFAGFKWLTWVRAREARAGAGHGRTLAYLFFWPGMDAAQFLDSRVVPERPRFREWVWATAKAALGAGLVWGLARLADGDLARGWIGMIGLIFLMHFGFFHGLALFWRTLGISATPLMRCPVAAKSVDELWGRRWNVAFQNLARDLFFLPMIGRVGAPVALLMTFGISGLIHELVISVPAGGGYGLPTAYFTLQGLGALAERGFRRFGRRAPLARRIFTWTVVAGPAGILFPPVFVDRVMIPFLQVIHAVPVR